MCANKKCGCGETITDAAMIGNRPCDCVVCRLCWSCIEASEEYARQNNEAGDSSVTYVARTKKKTEL